MRTHKVSNETWKSVIKYQKENKFWNYSVVPVVTECGFESPDSIAYKWEAVSCKKCLAKI